MSAPGVRRGLGLGAVLIAIIGFSFGSTIAKSAHLPVPVLLFWRLVVASLVWQAWCARPNSATPLRWSSDDPAIRRALKLCVLAGAMFGMNTLLFFNGILRTRVANAEFIIQLSPLFVIPIAARLLHERVEPVIIAFALLALSGVAVIVLSTETRGTHQWSGDLFVIAGLLIGVGFAFIIREARQKLDTAPVMATLSTAAALAVLPFALATGSITDVGWRGAFFITALALLSGVLGHGLQAWAQRLVPLSTISLLGLSQPALAASWAWLFLGESVRPVQIIGMALTLAAVGGVAMSSPPGKAWRLQRQQGRAMRSPMQ